MISPSIRAIFYKILSSFTSLIFVWVIAFFLPVKSAGIVLYFYTMVMVVVQFSRAGTEYGVIKKSALMEGRGNAELFLYVLLIVFCLAVSVSFFYALVAYFQGLYVYGDESFWCLLFLLLGAVIFSINQILATFHQLSGSIFLQYFYLNIGCTVCTVFFWVSFSYFWGGFNSIVFCFVFFVVNFFMFLCAFFYFDLNKSLSVYFVGFSSFKSKVSEIVRFVYPFSIVAFLTIIIQWGGAFLSGSFLSEEDLGVLSIVIRISTFSIFGFLAIETYMSPRLSRLKDYSEAGILNVTGAFSLISVLFCLSFVVFFAFFGEFFLAMLGDSYLKAYDYIMVISFFWLLRVLLGPVDVILLMAGKVGVIKKNLIIAGLVSVLFGVLLISQYQLWGAVFALAASRLLLSFLNSYYVLNIYGLLFVRPKTMAFCFSKACDYCFKRLLKNV
ncbi:MAG: lipopolysaccharide biosynthesis protein [Neptuniibacter sp.]